MNPIWRHAKAAEKHIPRTESFERRTRIVGAIHADLKAQADAERRRLGRDLTEGEQTRLLQAAGTPEQLAARHVGGPVRHDLVERYLAAVQRRLPETGASDIVNELREAIAGRLEATEAETGRAASREEVAAVLKSVGPPGLVAGRYAGREAIIGADLAPYFWPAHRMAFAIVGVTALAVSAISVASGGDPWQAGAQALNRLFELGLYGFALVTLVFVVLEGTGAGRRFREHWRPESLPADHIRAPRGLFDSLFGVAADLAFIVIWTGGADVASALADGREPSMVVSLSPAWELFWTPILLLAILSAVVHAADLIHPAWTRVRSAATILGNLAAALIALLLLASGPLIDVTVGSDASAPVERVASVLGLALAMSLWVGIVIWAWVALTEIARLVRSLRS